MQHRRPVHRRIAVLAALLVTSFAVTWTGSVARAAPETPLGDATIEPTSDPSALGTAEANQYVASASAQINGLAIYLDSSNAATAIALGVYADANGVPSSLIASGTSATVQSGAWNTVTIPLTSLVGGRAYWIARLSTGGGAIVTRVNASIPNPDRSDGRYGTSLPTTFSPAGSWPHLSSMYAISVGGPTPSASPAGAGSLGDSSIESNSDPSDLGVAEANQFVATTGGPVDQISIYIDVANGATSIALGIYGDAGGVPGALVTQGATTSVVNGGWNTVTVPAVSLAAGTPYWIARLSHAGGALVTRVAPATNPDRTDGRFDTSLPATFSPVGSYPHRTSMYAGTAGAPTPTAAPTPTTAPTPTPAPTPAPLPTPPAGSWTCLEVIGFSQTYQWYFGGPPSWDQFLSAVPPNSTQLRWQGGAAIDSWADPTFAGWTGGVESASCASSSANPDRIVLTITAAGYVSDVTWWHDEIAQAVANARARYSNLRTVYLQPVVGGPGHGPCYVGGVQVRATYNEPYIDRAIDTLVGEGVGVRGANPLVLSCGDYADDIGHLNDAARGAIAAGIGAFYAAR